jgi:inner membrane protein
MDVVTHVAVGAAIGKLVLGPQLGNRAMLYGIVAGTLPDLDVVLGPFEDDVTFLTSHRGITHSLLFVVAAGVALGWLLARWHRDADVGFRLAPTLALAALLVHVLLDACTTYGTPIFLPWSDYRVAFNTLFIIDPLFTLPLVACVLISLFFPSQATARQILAGVGIALCCLYLLVSVVNKWRVDRVFTTALAGQQHPVKRMMTAPLPLNNVLWFCLAEDEHGFWYGSHSLLAADRPVRFHYLPRGDSLLAGVKEAPLLRRLNWFSDGFCRLRQQDGVILFEVLKFGLFPQPKNDLQPALSFALGHDAEGRLTAVGVGRPRGVDERAVARWVWRQIWGLGDE